MKWTTKEDQVLTKNIGKHRKKVDAFAATTKQLPHRTVRACKDRWIELNKNFKREADSQTVTRDSVIQEEMVIELNEEKQRVDLLDEVSKVLRERYDYKVENEKLNNKVKDQEEENFQLCLLLDKANAEKEAAQLGLHKLEALVESHSKEQVRYIEENQKINSLYNELVSRHQAVTIQSKDKDVLIAELNRVNKRLKEEMEQAQGENSLIMNAFNLVRKKITGVGKDEKHKFKMAQNGDLERII